MAKKQVSVGFFIIFFKNNYFLYFALLRIRLCGAVIAVNKICLHSLLHFIPKNICQIIDNVHVSCFTEFFDTRKTEHVRHSHVGLFVADNIS